MKYIVVLGDGMADLPIDEFSGQTPMEAAEKPYMNYLAAHGTCGMAKTVPDDLPAGSDTANLSVMGFAVRSRQHGDRFEIIRCHLPLQFGNFV